MWTKIIILAVSLPLSPVESFQQSLFHLNGVTRGVKSSQAVSPPSININTQFNYDKPQLFQNTVNLQMSSKGGGSGEEEPRCPVTLFANDVQTKLSTLDNVILKRILKIANHIPTLLSLSYFGLVSMASMMSMGPMANAVTTSAKGAKVVVEATLASVLTKSVGSTTNAQFAALFPTYVTPAPFVFLVWPTIAILQLLTVTVSALYPSSDDDDNDDEILTQTDLSSLTIANLFSTAWILTASNAMEGSLPIGSFLILPFVPLFSGYTLRNKPTYVLWAYQLFSSFTTLASILAFTVELQHGGRIPIIGKLSAEWAACVFLSLYSVISLGVKEKSFVKRFVNFFALSGIIGRRVMDVMVMGSTGFFGALMSGALIFSVSFWGTIGCWYWSVRELFFGPKQ